MYSTGIQYLSLRATPGGCSPGSLGNNSRSLELTQGTGVIGTRHMKLEGVVEGRAVPEASRCQIEAVGSHCCGALLGGHGDGLKEPSLHETTNVTEG